MSSIEGKTKKGDKESVIGDSGTTEVSLSVEETNKLRAALGLKPLQESTTEVVVTHTREEEEKKAKAEDVRRKLQQAKEKRKEEAFFAKATPLAGKISDDDVAAWIRKTRTIDSSHQQEKLPFHPTEGISSDTIYLIERFCLEGEVTEDDEQEGIVPELVGTKVKHKSSDLKIGESMILTLEDQPILTATGELNTEEDALENTLKAEDARRKKAYEASKPKKDEAFDQYGNKKSLLSKYDEEEEEAMTLEQPEGIASDQTKTTRKHESLNTMRHPISDYTTEGPATEGGHPVKKRRRQKLRKKPTEVLDIVMELETQKRDVMDWEADHGTRSDRQRQIAEEQHLQQEAKIEKTKKFDRALEKANFQALKMKLLEENGGDEDDEELYDALHQAQRVASHSKERWQQLAENVQNLTSKTQTLPDNKKLVFTDTTEFCRLFSSDQIEVKKQEMDEDAMQTDDNPMSRSERRRHIRSKGIVLDDELGTDQQASNEKPEETETLSALREPVLGQGLATALNTLRAKGDLKQKFEWVGRTNDMKKSRLIGVDDFYTCGEADDRLEKSIETALTHKDHLGRVLTPKEAFREISYAFHGKGPSQRTLEKRKRKMNEDFLARRTNLDQESQLRRLKAVQKVQKNAFVVLSGAGQIGADIKPKKKKAIKTKTEGTSKPVVPSLTPVLNRGDKDTPLEGKKKVEAMFGMPPSE